MSAYRTATSTARLDAMPVGVAISIAASLAESIIDPEAREAAYVSGLTEEQGRALRSLKGFAYYSTCRTGLRERIDLAVDVLEEVQTAHESR